VYDNAATTKFALYIDGKLNKTANSSMPMNTTNSKVLVGTSSGGTFFKGDIDEVRVWNRALSACEIELFSSERYKKQFNFTVQLCGVFSTVNSCQLG
jgi:uncharacterized membrane protein